MKKTVGVSLAIAALLSLALNTFVVPAHGILVDVEDENTGIQYGSWSWAYVSGIPSYYTKKYSQVTYLHDYRKSTWTRLLQTVYMTNYPNSYVQPASETYITIHFDAEDGDGSWILIDSYALAQLPRIP